MKKLILVFLLFYINDLYSQDINGIWEGNYGKAFLMQNPQNVVVEIYSYNDSLFTGASHLYYKNNKYEHYTIKGKFNKKDSTLTFIEDSTISIKLGFMAGNCLGIYNTKISFTDSTINQKGKWKDKSKGLFRCPTTSVYFSKKIIPLVEKKDSSINVLTNNSTKRMTEIQSLIEVNKIDSDSIKIEIYDNGVVDNDTISMYYNDKLIVDKKMISINPITFYISLTEKYPIIKLKLIAESVGSVPPCTALMIVNVKKKRYEVNLSSDFYKNGVVEFFLKQ